MFDLILLSAGMGTRAKLNYPKQLMRLGGKPLVICTLEIFLNIDDIKNIIITVPPEMKNEFVNLIITYYPNKNIHVIDGGETRQQSVRFALEHVTAERVIVHESVRPFITKEHVLSLMEHKQCVVVPYLPIVPTIYNVNGYFEDRSKLVNIQLPQIFHSGLLKNAHHIGQNKKYTDDSSLVFVEMGIYPTLVNGLEENIKITSPIDIIIAEALYEEIGNRNRG
jgi:2-C-methyl-D-erythritol 4-phosphate cytidylyltransferase